MPPDHDPLTHLCMMTFFAHSGESESDEPSETDNHDSGDKSDLATAKRLKELEKCIFLLHSSIDILYRTANIAELLLIL